MKFQDLVFAFVFGGLAGAILVVGTNENQPPPGIIESDLPHSNPDLSTVRLESPDHRYAYVQGFEDGYTSGLQVERDRYVLRKIDLNDLPHKIIAIN